MTGSRFWGRTWLRSVSYILCGGNWLDDASYAKSRHRSDVGAGYGYRHFGLRLSRRVSC